jgi:hypothetical protein
MEKIIAEILSKIDSAIMDVASKKAPREYLGASSIGEECDRKLWYSFHKRRPINDPRVHRIMDLGHWVESYSLEKLKSAGYELFYEEGGEQFGFVDEEVAGHADGVIILNDTPHLLEIKSANNKRFLEMVDMGVERSNLTYFVQMQVYMHFLELEKALYFVVNKDNSKIHMEIIKYEKIRAVYYLNRGKEIIRGKEEDQERKYKTKAFFKCKWCDYKEECWSTEPSEVTKAMSSHVKFGKDFLLPK